MGQETSSKYAAIFVWLPILIPKNLIPVVIIAIDILVGLQSMAYFML